MVAESRRTFMCTKDCVYVAKDALTYELNILPKRLLAVFLVPCYFISVTSMHLWLAVLTGEQNPADTLQSP